MARFSASRSALYGLIAWFGAVACSSSSSSDRGADDDGPATGGATTGSGGSGGTTSATGGAPSCNPALLTDMETREGRAAWSISNDGTATGTQFPPGGSPTERDENGSYVVHTNGDGFTTWGASAVWTRPADLGCSDLNGSSGIRFRAKGPARITVMAQVRGVLPAPQGDCASNCYDSHKTATPLNFVGDWAEYEVSWSSLAQTGFGSPVTFSPTDIVTLVFTAGPQDMPFDFAIDDVMLLGVQGGTGGTTGTGGGPSTTPSPAADFIDEAMFNSMFPARNAFYTYSDFINAAASEPFFAGQGDETTRKREIAAFLGQVAHETGKLEAVRENNQNNDYCDETQAYGCPAGTFGYYGRGPMQLSWNFNYYAAGRANYIDTDLLNQPDLVATDGLIAWKTAIWFWMNSAPAGTTPHGAMVSGGGFGETTRAINGDLECDGGPSSSAQQWRVQFYTEFCNLLGVDPGPNLNC